MESAKNLKKYLIVIVNVIIMVGILVFVVLYSGFENRDSYRRQIANFENTTVTIEQVTANYLEGDVPMMICSGDAVSGTKKRESRSEAFIANPFKYTFTPVPITDDGAVFVDMANLQFSVNKDSKNLEMANEFMRFLITQTELNEMAKNKGLMPPTKDLSFNSMYAAFGEVPESRILSPEVIGVTDDAVLQLRQAGYCVGTGKMTIDEAIATYGKFET